MVLTEKKNIYPIKDCQLDNNNIIFIYLWSTNDQFITYLSIINQKIFSYLLTYYLKKKLIIVVNNNKIKFLCDTLCYSFILFFKNYCFFLFKIYYYVLFKNYYNDYLLFLILKSILICFKKIIFNIVSILVFLYIVLFY